MNERIKELWNKAAELTSAFPSGQNNSWETQVNFMEKFAELIVRECIDIAQDRANFPGFPPNDVNDIIDDIREHFGVGMSIEDKKTLIKELLGMKNETNQ